jgi:AraC-like DNA-binding protein
MSTSSIVSQLADIRSKQPWLVLNSAEKFSLSPSDNQAISHYYSFEPNKSVEQTFAIPDGCVDILFDCDDSHPSAEVFGTPMEAITIELNKGHRYFGMRFVSGVMPDFLNVSAGELVGQHHNLLDIVPQVNQIFEDVVTSSDFSQQVSCLEQFFNNKEMRKSSNLTSQALRGICESNGTIRINELEELTGYTSRTLQRQFRADMGMSPKAFCRIIRCQSAVYGLNHREKVTFSDLACDLGFSDQSHFLREFKKLVHTTPLDYLTRVKHQTYLERIRYL